MQNDEILGEPLGLPSVLKPPRDYFVVGDLVRNVLSSTIGESLRKLKKYSKNSFIAVPSSNERNYYKDGLNKLSRYVRAD